MNVFEKMFGTHSERELKRITSLVDKIEALRPDMQALSDEELQGKTREYKNRLQEGETLDDLLPEAFATVREAAKQVNIRLNAYREHYRNVAPEKIIAMVAYQFSLEKLQLLQRNDTQPYTAKIEELTEMLEEYFRNEE